MAKISLILQFVSTFYLTGLIWTIQLVQYPFFSYFKDSSFTKYHDDYRFWITPVVAPAMLAELFTAIFLMLFPPSEIDYKLLIFGFVLVAVIWISTFFLQVPMHEKLAAGFDENAHKILVNTNWIRTFTWSLRSVLMIYLLWKTLKV
ncbi:MAG TPA: hypothetical protein PKY59_01495 [Pyrinomonadaceae bacterium]|nr:hypothetical protein [Pyrinomonadaceae bacterium]